MAISSYATLVTAIGNWLNRSDLASYIPDFVSLAEARVYRELRLNAMLTSFSGTTSSGVIAVPSDFLEFSRVHVATDPITPLTVVTPDYIYSTWPNRSADGIPRVIARDGSNFVFGPFPDSDYSILGSYYKRMTALVSASTNWFTSNAPDLLLYASLVEAEPFIMNDERLVLWEGKYQQAKRAIEREDRRASNRGGVRSVTAA